MALVVAAVAVEVAVAQLAAAAAGAAPLMWWWWWPWMASVRLFIVGREGPRRGARWPLGSSRGQDAARAAWQPPDYCRQNYPPAHVPSLAFFRPFSVREL
jgi:hypothetical protein